MTNWQEVKLGEICTIIDGDRGKNYPKSNELQPQGYCLFLNTKNVPDNKFNFSECTFISKDKDELLGKGKLNYGDIVVTTRGTLANFAYYTKKCIYNKIRINSGMVILRNENKDLCTHYLYHFLISNNFKQQVQSLATGSAQPQLPIKDMKNIIMNLPPLDVQKKIAGVLGALDDKIELNNKINNNLEQQAQALFKSWFVDIKETSQSNEKFGYIPQNATVKKVGELPVFITDYVANGSFASLKENVTLYQNKNYAYFIRNTDLKSNSFEVYVDEHSYKFLSKSSLFGNEIIISNVGDVGSVFLCPKLDLPMTLGNNIIMLRAETDSYLDFYLYIWFKWSYGQELIQGIKGGSAQPKFNKTDFKGLPVILPSQQQLKEFNAAVTPVFNKISQNNQENIRLAQLRDTLLPKLMSGEIDVSKVDINKFNAADKLL